VSLKWGVIVQKRSRIPKGQSKMDNPEEKHKHNMCWTPLYANKHK